MPICKVGTEDFKELRNDGGYFVDKSLLINDAGLQTIHHPLF